MRDPNRITEVLEQIEKIWRLHPDWRLGQLLSNLAAWNNPTAREAVWDIEDDVLITEIQKHITQSKHPVETKG